MVATNAEARRVLESRAVQPYLRGKQRRPDASYTLASHVYARPSWLDRPHAGDTLQVGFDVLPGWEHHGMRLGSNTVPTGFHAMPDTDYEYCAYACVDGMSEIWRYLAPGVPRTHGSPRQPKSPKDQGSVKGGRCTVIRDGTLLIYELAIPWTELEGWKPRVGQRFGGIVRINDNAGPPLTFGMGKSATKDNSLSLHPFHEPKPSCGVEWVLGE
jgi:hypothetical protein